MNYSDWREAFSILEDERNSRLDDGEDMDSIYIDFENRLWRMKKAGRTEKEPEVCALQEMIQWHNAFLAYQHYKENGWRKKYSGEWVKREE